MTAPPAGLVIERLPEQPCDAHTQARRFCLETIKEFYGFDYRRDWHLDLDSLLLPAAESHYSRHHGGAFWNLRNLSGDIVGTAGIRHLAWKPNNIAMFPDRYGRGEEVASLWRVYVREDQRGHGLGRWLTTLCEMEAERLGYATMYLHATSDAVATCGVLESGRLRPHGGLRNEHSLRQADRNRYNEHKSPKGIRYENRLLFALISRTVLPRAFGTGLRHPGHDVPGQQTWTRG